MKKVLIIGAGPAGLAAAHRLLKNDVEVHLFESHSQDVGGLSKTIHHKNFKFDIGGHRFFTKSEEVQEFWTSILGDKFQKKNRLSRIYFLGKFFNYPLDLTDVLLKIGPIKSFEFLISYLKAQIFFKRNIETLEDWLIKHFGESLYRSFFQSYSEKVWGRRCNQISADWAAQRINDLNVKEVLKQFLKKLFPFFKTPEIKTLIGQFDYPEKGPGMLWEMVAKEIQGMGGKIYFGHQVSSLIYDADSSDSPWELSFKDKDFKIKGTDVISSAPLKEILTNLTPRIENSLNQNLKEMQYRDFLMISVMFKLRESFPDNWIYIHDKSVKVARIQNFKNWSNFMVPSIDYTSYGLEYFCQEGDELWNKSDQELFELAKTEIKKIKIPFSEEELSFHVIRVPKAYPVYDEAHNERMEQIKCILKNYPGLQIAGRNGMHRYNNQDHSIKTAFLCVDNILQGENLYDPWQVNQDAVYLEK